MVTMGYNPPHKYLRKKLTNIIRVMQNIGLNISPFKATFTLEHFGTISDQMAHDLPIICS